METAPVCILLEKPTMTSPEIQQAAFLDLLFESRNKLYGAYPLRKYYNQRLLIALCLSLALASLLFVLIAATKKKKAGFFLKIRTMWFYVLLALNRPNHPNQQHFKSRNLMQIG